MKTNEKSKKTDKEERNYKVVIDDVVDEAIDATFTDIETNEVYKIEKDKLHASFAFLVPIGVVIGEWLLSQLLAMALAITIGSISYTLVTEVAATKGTSTNSILFKDRTLL